MNSKVVDESYLDLENLSSAFHLIHTDSNAVFLKHSQQPDVVYKVFKKESIHKLDSEYKIYQYLQESPYFPKCFGKGENYLVLSYEQGPTLYQCLERGIYIPEQVITDVDQAIAFAKKQGLYPQNIHLKNVLLQGQHAKIIDVSNYLSPNQDHQWDHVATGYDHIYPYIQGKKIPSFLIDKMKRIYYSDDQDPRAVYDYITKVFQQPLKLKRLQN